MDNSEDVLEIIKQTVAIGSSSHTTGISAEKLNFLSFTRESLTDYLKSNFKSAEYNSTQLFQWVYKRSVRDFSQMTDLSKQLREELLNRFIFPKLSFETRQISNDGTRKYLIKVGNDLVESVMIKQPKRMTLCVSSQVGCGMGCKFCRTATMGFRRNLSVEEILLQVLTVQEDAKNFNDMFSNIVFMGMGEPLHNFTGVSQALKILTDTNGLGIAPRKITVSTVGLVKKIDEFRELGTANLAVSLNATTDEIRSQIMPVNKAFPISELIAALKRYPKNSRRKVTIEYVMLSGINDTDQDLARLPKLLAGIPAKVNLIPYNENAGLGFKTPSKDHVSKWVKQLTNKNLDVTVRWSKGVDISAACGQLAVQKMN